MSRAANECERADHRRDLLKHEPRPTDPINAVEIAVLVKGMSNILDAAKLIDSYAACVAAGARLEGAELVYERLDAVLP